MTFFENLSGATPQTKRVLETFGKVVKKKVGMDVSIDISVDASEIGEEWFGIENNIVFDDKSVSSLIEEIRKWSLSSNITLGDCRIKKLFAIAYYLTNNKGNKLFMQRHFKKICFSMKEERVGAIKPFVYGKVLYVECKANDVSALFSTNEVIDICNEIIENLRENVGIRASIRKKIFKYKSKKGTGQE